MLSLSSTNRFRTAVVVFSMVFLGLLGVAAGTRADTIVLKNGRRILAFNVVEVGEKIRYETSAGELSLPKSIVDHIEKGGAVPLAGSGAANAVQPGHHPTFHGHRWERTAEKSNIPQFTTERLTGNTSRNSRAKRGAVLRRRESMPRSAITRRLCSNFRAAIWITRLPTSAPR